MIAAGFTPSDESDNSDIIIINTCGFINDAREESIEVIMDASLQQSYGESRDSRKKIVVIGCLSKRYYSELNKELSEADFIYGLYDEMFIPEMCSALDINFGGKLPEGRFSLVPGLSYSYIKISEGCSNNCSYCAIPIIRGPRRSFSPEAILKDARAAVSNGAKELIVIAQDSAAYSYDNKDISSILNMLSEIPGVEWIRLMYCHPDNITSSLIGTIAENEKVVKYLDIPFQHASKPVLESMNRKGSGESYLALLDRIRSKVPDIRIRSTFMVGFPGETRADFEELLSFIRRAGIDRAGAFSYSPEEDTAAFMMKGKVSGKVKNARYAELMELLKYISASRLEAMTGNRVSVLIEEKLDENLWAGRSEYDAPEVDGIFFLTAEGVAVNSIVSAKITGSSEYDLYGELF